MPTMGGWAMLARLCVLWAFVTSGSEVRFSEVRTGRVGGEGGGEQQQCWRWQQQQQQQQLFGLLGRLR